MGKDFVDAGHDSLSWSLHLSFHYIMHIYFENKHFRLQSNFIFLVQNWQY